MTDTIHFKSLHMYRYSSSKELKGTITIESSDGAEIKVNLPHEAFEPVVDILANHLAEATKVQVDRLREAILGRQENG